MSTVGTLIINLAMNTAGLATGISQAEAQLMSLEATIAGVGITATNTSVGMLRLAAAKDAVTVAAARLKVAEESQRMAAEAQNIAQLRLAESTLNVNLAQSERAAIQARVRQSTVASAAADEQAALAAANLAKAHAAVAEAKLAKTATVASAAPVQNFSMITAAAGLASLAVLKFGYDSAKVAADFEYEMLLIQTQANASETELTNMTAAVLDLASQGVQAGPVELAKGLYHLESVSIRGAQALDILKTAAMGAATDNAALEDVTNALIAAVVSGISDVQGMSHGITDMGQAMGILNGIVGSGNVRMKELAASLSSGVLSTARQFGLSIQEVGAALATMTDQGIPAEEAATRLRITIALLAAPTKLATQELAKVGLTERSLADEMRSERGLIGALRMLRAHMDGAGLDAVEQSQLLKTAFGGSRSSAGLLTLINSLELMDTKLDVISSKGHSFAEDFAEESKTARAHFENLAATIDVLQVRVGNALVPVLIVLSSVMVELAKHTEVIVPLFLALTAAIIFAAGKAAFGLIASMVSIIANMVVASASSFVLSGAFKNLTVDTSMLASAEAALAETQAMVAISTVPLVTAIEGEGFVMYETAGAAAALTTAEAGLAAVAPGVAAGSTAAAGGVSVLGVAVGALMLPITLIAIAVGLLIVKFDEVSQGVRVVAYAFTGAMKTVYDVLGMLPLVGDFFKGEASRMQGNLDTIAAEAGRAQGVIEKKAAESGEAGIKSMIDSAKAAAAGGFDDLDATLAELFGTNLAGAQAAAQFAGAEEMRAYAKGLYDSQQLPIQAFKDFQNVMATSFDQQTEIAQLLGMLQGQELANGLASTNAAQWSAADGLRKTIIERLDAITEGAYSAGRNAGMSWQEAFLDGLHEKGESATDIATTMKEMTPAQIDEHATAYQTLIHAFDDMAPSATTAAAAYQDLLKSIESGGQTISQAASQAKSDLTSAFNEIKAKALEYFDAVHEKTMQAISDARDHKNELLDAKAALNQAPVTAAQKALDFQRQAQREWQLREAVAHATTPEAQRDAVLALQDFLAQKHIDMMQDEVDLANEAIQKQKDANDDAFNAQVKAENKRYEQQKKSFSRELEALERYLRSHPGEWAKANGKVLKLLQSYGVDYAAAGALLGSEFTTALTAQLSVVTKALEVISKAIKKVVKDSQQILNPLAGVPYGAIYDIPQGVYASGAWDLGKDQTARVHAREMILNPNIAGSVRGLLGQGRGMSAIPRLVAFGLQAEKAQVGVGGPVRMPFPPGGGPRPSLLGSPDVGTGFGSERRGPQTLVVQIGSEKLAEIMDEELYSSSSMYGRRGTVRVKARR